MSAPSGCGKSTLIDLLLQEYPDLPLDYVEITGEKMTVNPPCRGRLLNVYGPTECTVDTSYYRIQLNGDINNNKFDLKLKEIR